MNLAQMRRIDAQVLEALFYGLRQMKKHLWHPEHTIYPYLQMGVPPFAGSGNRQASP